MDAFAPYLSYFSLGLFGVTCFGCTLALTMKMPKKVLTLIVTLGLMSGLFMSCASAALYIWHHHYR